MAARRGKYHSKAEPLHKGTTTKRQSHSKAEPVKGRATQRQSHSKAEPLIKGRASPKC